MNVVFPAVHAEHLPQLPDLLASALSDPLVHCVLVLADEAALSGAREICDRIDAERIIVDHLGNANAYNVAESPDLAHASVTPVLDAHRAQREANESAARVIAFPPIHARDLPKLLDSIVLALSDSRVDGVLVLAVDDEVLEGVRAIVRMLKDERVLVDHIDNAEQYGLEQVRKEETEQC